MIEVKNVTKIFNQKSGTPQCALSCVNLTFPETGMHFIIGKSGSGKTTILNLIGQLDFPTGGEIRYDGKLVTSKNERYNFLSTKIDFIFQDCDLINDMNVAELLYSHIPQRFKDNADEEIRGVLKTVGLPENFYFKNSSNISGGEAQRIAIASALLRRSKVILADEPTAHLDAENAKNIFSVLKKLSETHLVICVTHNSALAELFGDRIVEFANGAVVSDIKCDSFSGGFWSEDGNGNLQIKKGTEADARVAEVINRHRGKNVKIQRPFYRKYASLQTEVVPKTTFVGPLADYEPFKLKHFFYFTLRDFLRAKSKTMLAIFMLALSFSIIGLSVAFTTQSIGAMKLNDFDTYGSRGVYYTYSGEPKNRFVRERNNLLEITPEKLGELKGIIGDEVPLVPWYKGQLPLSFQTTNVSNMPYRTEFAGFSPLTESDLRNIGRGMTVIRGDFPLTSKRNEDNVYSVAITDYTAFMIEKFGATSLSRLNLRGYKQEDLIGETLILNNTVFLHICAIVDTDYEKYIGFSQLETITTPEEADGLLFINDATGGVTHEYDLLMIAPDALSEFIALFTDTENLNPAENVAPFGYFAPLPSADYVRTMQINLLEEIYFNAGLPAGGTTENIYDFSKNIRIVFYEFGGLLLIIAFIFVLDYTMHNAKFRQRNIGILLANGMRRRRVGTMFVTQAVALFILTGALFSAFISAFLPLTDFVFKTEYARSLGNEAIKLHTVISFNSAVYLLPIGAMAILLLTISAIVTIIFVHKSIPDLLNARNKSFNRKKRAAAAASARAAAN